MMVGRSWFSCGFFLWGDVPSRICESTRLGEAESITVLEPQVFEPRERFAVWEMLRYLCLWTERLAPIATGVPLPAGTSILVGRREHSAISTPTVGPLS